MTLYKLDEWEHNGRDDSDWYAVVYDDETDKLQRVQTGTTRFADALHMGPPMLDPTPEILVKARAALVIIIFGQLKLFEESKVMQPGPADIGPGVRLRFSEDHRCMAKEKVSAPCEKCAGTGHWTNPRNESDKRDCFGCKGQGEIVTSFTRKKTDDGKQEWIAIKKGEAGVVMFAKSWGTFYRNGYSHPDRHNTTVTIKLDDGREVRTPLSKLRLDQEIDSDEKLKKLAETYAEWGRFYTPFATAGIRL